MSRTTPGFATALDQAVEEAEHRANLIRFRTLAIVGLVIWIALLGADALMAWVVHPGPLWFYAAIRLAAAPTLVWAIYRTGASPPMTRAEFRRTDALVVLSVGWGVSAMCVVAGGLTSMYITGLTCIIVGRGVALAQPWRDSAAVNLVILVGHPVILAVGALFRQEVAAQWRDPQQVAGLAVGLALVGSTTLLVVYGAQAHWWLRRQVLRSETVGRYELVEKLGEGGMGEVWRARVRGFRQDVALKLLPPRPGDAGVDRFEREVSALSALHHPNTVRIFDYGVAENGVSFYAMELLNGRTLDTLVREEGPQPIPDVLDVMIQVASALGEAHRAGIVHRDVKPANLMVVEGAPGRWTAKVLDFGIALPDDALERTRTGMVVGTPAYLAPEAARGQTVGTTGDVYQIGCVLFFLLAGRPPFVGELNEMLSGHLSGSVPSLSALVGVPAALEDVVNTCLDKNPDLRFQSGDEVAEALMMVRGELGPAATPAPATRRRQAPTQSVYEPGEDTLAAGQAVTRSTLDWSIEDEVSGP